MTDLLILAAVMLATGAVGGVLAGLLGIGGGIVIVPALDAALSFLHVDPAIRMHMAVATSLATIIPTSIASSRAHHKRVAIDIDLVRRWAIFVILGSLLGSWIAAQVDSRVLYIVFASVALIIAIKLVLPLQGKTLSQDVPRGSLVLLVPPCIGTVSSMMGI
ncbi:MAG: sulfite exporter TauE/SafE family protein, partial [Proteobacteria bacterium]|nr:sulfite exporter TauE/SafE family protein [Pseudomonadota bacterium]